VVETDPDVPHTLARVIDELLPAARRRKLEALQRRVRAQHGGARGALGAQLEQAAVLRIEIREQAVIDREARRTRRLALHGQRQHRVGAVGVAVHQLLADCKRASAVVGAHGQPRARIGSDVGMARAQLAPGDLAVAVGIERERDVEVAQRDVPLAAQSCSADVDRQVAVRRLVCARHRRRQHEQCRGEADQRGSQRAHRSAVSCCAMRCNATP
jgi:hypothetical protein